MKMALDRITEMGTLAIPKEVHSLSEVQFVFDEIAGQTDDAYLVPCSHSLNPSALAQDIQQAEDELEFRIPSDYKDFLHITNGAKLFCAPRKWLQDHLPQAMHVRFHLFSCKELVQINKNLLKTFRAAYARDPEYRDCLRLNYLAFCYAEDGNYQSLLLDDFRDSQVFLLFHEFSYRPYDVRDADLNYKIADSLQSWLELIRDSGGWEGRGEMTSGL